MLDAEPTSKNVTLGRLWKEFLPLSMSDVTMACGDPLVTSSLAHLPDGRSNIAALGIAKSLAVFFESPIIMILHASNALADNKASRKALWRFVLLSCAVLTTLLVLITIPAVFQYLAASVMGIDDDLTQRARSILLLILIWPSAIAWRRYFQGLLIHGNQAHIVGKAGIARLVVLVSVLAIGLWTKVSGEHLAGLALLAGILTETVWVTVAAYRIGVTRDPPQNTDSRQPDDLQGVMKFYWPLANSMVVVWGGRALLIAVVARSQDAAIALAAWPAAWAIVLVIANATRMVQQVIIRNRKRVATTRLLVFAISVGLAFTLLLWFLGATSWGQMALDAFLGQDLQLLLAVKPVIVLCSIAPLLIALQNACQGFLISEGHTGRINIATWLGTAVLLCAALVFVQLGMPGTQAASYAMMMALTSETLWLGIGLLGIAPTAIGTLVDTRILKKP